MEQNKNQDNDSASPFSTKVYKFKSSKSKKSPAPSSITLPLRPKNLKNHELIREFYISLKAIVISLEKTNDRFVIVYHRENDYWQFGGLSLLFYRHHLRKQYNLPEVHPRDDTDFTLKWPDHECAFVRKIDSFCLHLENKAHATRILDTPELIIFELEKPYSHSDIQGFESILKNKHAQFNRLVGVKNVDAVTHNLASQLHRETVNRVSKFPTIDREIHGYAGAKITYKIVENFSNMALGNANEIYFYRNAIKDVEKYLSWLVIIRNLNLMEIETSIRIADLAIRLKEHLKRSEQRVTNRSMQERKINNG